MDEQELKLWERIVFVTFLCLSGSVSVVGVATIVAWVFYR